MTDRELLELAAKAAGMRVEFIGDNPHDCTDLKPGNPTYKGSYWNPLTDDGDALRLACSLGKKFSGAAIWISQSGATVNFPLGPNVDADVDDVDLNAATRRAIVLAAAEIGKGQA